MGDEMKKSPNIRFTGFSDDWQNCKLGDYIIQYNEITTKNNQYPVFTSSRKGLFFQTDYYDGNQIASEDNTGYNIVPRGYFTYRHMSDDLVFKFNINNLADNGIVSTLYPVFTTKDSLDSKYLQYQLNEGEEFKRFAILQKQGGSRTYMYLSKLKNMMITIPKFDEQIKIGNLFKTLDDTISLHQRKLELLKVTKKSMLQKMFPKDGESIPEIRFAGFTDAWEQRKLGELADIVRGASPRPIQDPKWFDKENSEIGWLRISDVTEQNGRIHFLEQRISKDGQSKTRVVLEPHLLLSIAATVGKPVVNYVKTGVHDGFLIFLTPQFEREFMFQWLEMYRPKWQQFGQPGSQVNLNSEIVKNAEILIPSIKEQKQIGDYFQNIDNIITLHQREVDLLKDLKKSMIKQMFI